jgi:hypothetical protein
MRLFVAVSGDPDTNIEAQSEDDIAEQGKTPAVTEGAVRNTDQGISHTTSSGVITFRSVVKVSWLCMSLTRGTKFLRHSHKSMCINKRI